MILYHITKVENVESIMERGILPSYKKGITCGDRKHTQVFLTNNVNKIIETQIGHSWEKELVIFEVDVDNAKPHKYYCFEPSKNSDFEFVIDKVNKKNIKKYGKLQS